MPEKDNILSGCTTTLKETTYSFMNVTLIEESVYERLNSAFKNFNDSVKKLSQNPGYEDKKSKIGVYNNANFLFGVGYQTIASVNFNDCSIKRIMENNWVRHARASTPWKPTKICGNYEVDDWQG